MGLKFRTNFIMQENPFVSGMGSTLNIGENYFDYDIASSTQEDDADAICMDWMMIGEDIANSMQ